MVPLQSVALLCCLLLDTSLSACTELAANGCKLRILQLNTVP
jgi:hypothetical protein